MIKIVDRFDSETLAVAMAAAKQHISGEACKVFEDAFEALLLATGPLRASDAIFRAKNPGTLEHKYPSFSSGLQNDTALHARTRNVALKRTNLQRDALPPLGGLIGADARTRR